jgi:hypothetical protein
MPGCMSESRAKLGMTFWVPIALFFALIGYPLSIGPACWVSSRANAGASAVSFIYRPLISGMSKSERVAGAIEWYSELGSASGWAWVEMEFDNPEIRRWQLRPPAVPGMF